MVLLSLLQGFDVCVGEMGSLVCMGHFLLAMEDEMGWMEAWRLAVAATDEGGAVCGMDECGTTLEAGVVATANWTGDKQLQFMSTTSTPSSSLESDLALGQSRRRWRGMAEGDVRRGPRIF